MSRGEEKTEKEGGTYFRCSECSYYRKENEELRNVVYIRKKGRKLDKGSYMAQQKYKINGKNNKLRLRQHLYASLDDSSITQKRNEGKKS